MPSNTRKMAISESGPGTSESGQSEGDNMLTVVIDRFEAMLDSVTSAFSDMFKRSVEKLIDGLEQKISRRLDIHSGEMFDINKHLDFMEKLIKDLNKKMKL